MIENENIEAANSDFRSGKDRRKFYDLSYNFTDQERRKISRRNLLDINERKFFSIEVKRKVAVEQSLLEEAADLLIRLRDDLLLLDKDKVSHKQINAFLEKIK